MPIGRNRSLAIFFVGVAFAVSPALAAIRPHCHPTTICTLNPASCIRAPSSLPDVDGGDDTAADGWTLGSRCGVSKSTGLLCGNYIGRDLCPDEAYCECGPGHPDPCETGAPPVFEQSFLASLPGPLEVALFEGVAAYGRGMRGVAPAAETAPLRERLRPFSSRLPRELAALWQQLAALESAYWKASVEVWMAASIAPQQKEMTGRGTYEYWEAGNRYRVHVDLPKELGLSQISEIACDGTLRQMSWEDMGTITLSREDTRIVPVAVFNPVLLPLSLLAPPSDACPRCELRLADLKAVRPRIVNGTAPSSTVFRFGGDIVHEVTFSEVGELAAIVSKEPRGRLLTRAFFSEHQAVPGAAWRLPRAIRFEVISEAPAAEAPVLVTTYRIEHLAFNQRFAPSTFQLSWEHADYVWDDQRQIHIKRPGRLSEPREKPKN